MVAWRHGIYLLVFKKYFTRPLHSLVKYFLTLEKKFRISARPCNILYICLRRKKLGSFSIDEGNGSENVTFEMNSRFFNLRVVINNYSLKSR